MKISLMHQMCLKNFWYGNDPQWDFLCICANDLLQSKSHVGSHSECSD